MAEEWVSEAEMLRILAGSRRVARHWWTNEQVAGVLEAVRQRGSGCGPEVGVWSVQPDAAGWRDERGRYPLMVDATDAGRDWLRSVLQKLEARDGTAHSS